MALVWARASAASPGTGICIGMGTGTSIHTKPWHQYWCWHQHHYQHQCQHQHQGLALVLASATVSGSAPVSAPALALVSALLPVSAPVPALAPHQHRPSAGTGTSTEPRAPGLPPQLCPQRHPRVGKGVTPLGLCCWDPASSSSKHPVTPGATSPRPQGEEHPATLTPTPGPPSWPETDRTPTCGTALGLGTPCALTPTLGPFGPTAPGAGAGGRPGKSVTVLFSWKPEEAPLTLGAAGSVRVGRGGVPSAGYERDGPRLRAGRTVGQEGLTG